MRLSLLPFLLLPLVLTGCLPRTTVHKNPGPHDLGVRYYRPKPYLFIRPMTDRDGRPVAGYVNLEQRTLPDYSEEYSIHVRSGLGTNDTEIQLEDGWKLTALNISVDSQFDESLRAMADVIEAVPRATAATSEQLPAMVVRASNVPLGLYEAVLSAGPDCIKRLYGFRYVGFMPYAACPLESGGMERMACCEGEIYGLVMEDGVMVFRPLDEVSTHLQTGRIKITEERVPLGEDPLSQRDLLEDDLSLEPLETPAPLPDPGGLP